MIRHIGDKNKLMSFLFCIGTKDTSKVINLKSPYNLGSTAVKIFKITKTTRLILTDKNRNITKHLYFFTASNIRRLETVSVIFRSHHKLLLSR